MLQKFNVMLVGHMVFVGDNDDPLADGSRHYAAYNPHTFNLHIDPQWLNNLDPGSSNGWHVAASMLHEAAWSLIPISVEELLFAIPETPISTI